MAGKATGQKEREMLETMRDWTPERRRDYLVRADELDRTLRWIERRDKAIAEPTKVDAPFDLSAEVASRLAAEELYATFGIPASTESTADASKEAEPELTTG